MHDGPNVRRPDVIGRLRAWWDAWNDFWVDDDAAERRRAAAAEPRRALIPDYEVYEPPPSRWRKLRSERPSFRWRKTAVRRFEGCVRFAAFIVTLCLAALFVPVGLIFLVADITDSDVSWLSTMALTMGMGLMVSFIIALPEGASSDGFGGG